MGASVSAKSGCMATTSGNKKCVWQLQQAPCEWVQLGCECMSLRVGTCSLVPCEWVQMGNCVGYMQYVMPLGQCKRYGPQLPCSLVSREWVQVQKVCEWVQSWHKRCVSGYMLVGGCVRDIVSEVCVLVLKVQWLWVWVQGGSSNCE
jgi:hypothetical protein